MAVAAAARLFREQSNVRPRNDARRISILDWTPACQSATCEHSAA